MRGRSGTIIVALVMVLGLGLGSLGAWWVVHARPRPGDFIDVRATNEGAVVIRRERSSDHAFLEIYDGSHLRWRGMVPQYAGRPGAPAMAMSNRSVTVRVARGGHPHLFAFDAATGAKVDSFDLTPDAPPDASAYTLATVATVNDGAHGAEILAAPGGGTLVIGVALDERRLAWKKTVPGTATDAWITGDTLVIASGSAGDVRHAFALTDGAERPAPTGAPPPHPPGAAGGRIWTVTPRAITVTNAATRETMATIR
jgi:hypothetical protein